MLDRPLKWWCNFNLEFMYRYGGLSGVVYRYWKNRYQPIEDEE